MVKHLFWLVLMAATALLAWDEYHGMGQGEKTAYRANVEAGASGRLP